MALTPNMGLNQTVQGVTSGPSYATQIDANWGIADAHTHLAGSGVLIQAAALNINSSVNWGGNAITNASSITTTSLNATQLSASLSLNSFNLTSGGTIGCTTLNVSGTATLGTLATSNLSLSGTLAVTGTSTLGVVNGSGLLTLSGTGTALSVTNNATVSGTLSIGTGVSEATASTALTLKGNAAATSGTGVVLSNAIAQTSGTALSVYAGPTNSNNVFNIDFAGTITAANPANHNGYVISSNLGSILWGPNSGNGPLLLAGLPAATGGPSVSADTQGVTMTAGTVFQVNNNGTAQANIDYAGNLNLLTGGKIYQKAATTKLTLYGNGAGVTTDTQSTVASGNLLQVNNNNSIKAYVDYNGQVVGLHLGGNNAAAAPSGTSIPSGFGTPTLTGNDACGVISIVSSTTTAIGNGLLFQINFGTAYVARATCLIMPANTGTATALSACNPYIVTTTSQVNFYLAAGFTPSTGVTYSWNYLVLGT